MTKQFYNTNLKNYVHFLHFKEIHLHFEVQIEIHYKFTEINLTQNKSNLISKLHTKLYMKGGPIFNRQ